MKTLLLPKAVMLGAALLVGLAAQARALPPSHRLMTGTIERVDRSHRIMAVRGTETRKATSFAWNERTRFVVSWRFADVGALHAGDTVVVTYRWPWFEERFATKVVVAAPGRPQKAARARE